MTSLPFEDLPPSQQFQATGFTEFYAAYPRKVGPRKALEAYRKAIKRGVHHSDIVAGLARYKAHRKPDYQDWMYPATFLNGDHCYNQYGDATLADPELAWQHKAAMAKTSWGRHNVCRQDIEECHRRGLLTDEELREALR